MKETNENSNAGQSIGVSLTLACGNAQGGITKGKAVVNVLDTSSEESGTEGAY